MTNDIKNEKIVERIRKLFNMSQDASSPNEAAIALKRCRSLMDAHGITEADLTTSEFGTDSSYAGKSLAMWRQFMSIGIAAFTDTIVTIEMRRINGVKMQSIVFKGFDQDVQSAILLSDYLGGTMERSLKVYKADTDNTGKAASTSFKNSFALAVSNRMRELAKESAEVSPSTSNGTALVVCKQKMVEEKYGKQRTRQNNRGVSDADAATSGYSAGQKVNLNRQVSNKNNAVLT